MTSQQDFTHKFVVRFSVRVREQIAAAAKHHHRSMNSEIVARLEQSFSADPAEIHDPGGRVAQSYLQSPPGNLISQDEEAVLLAFRQLPRDKQQALLTLLG